MDFEPDEALNTADFWKKINGQGFLIHRHDDSLFVKKIDIGDGVEYVEKFSTYQEAVIFSNDKINECVKSTFRVLAYLNRGFGHEPITIGTVTCDTEETAKKLADDVAKKYLMNDSDLSAFGDKKWKDVEVRIYPDYLFKK